jgi:hypothetical protein
MSRYYEDERKVVMDRANWRCEYVDHLGVRCERPATHCAHRIPQRKHLIKKYGEAVIFARENLAAVCGTPGMSGDHNGRVQLLDYQWRNEAERIASAVEERKKPVARRSGT